MARSRIVRHHPRRRFPTGRISHRGEPGHRIPPATAARLAETPVDEILALNLPRRPVLPANGSQSSVILASQVETFLLNLSCYDPPAAAGALYELQDGEGSEGVGRPPGHLRRGCARSMARRRGAGSAAATSLIVPSIATGERITLASLLPTKPQAGAVEPPPVRTPSSSTRWSSGKNGKSVVVERKVAVSESAPRQESKSGHDADDRRATAGDKKSTGQEDQGGTTPTREVKEEKPAAKALAGCRGEGQALQGQGSQALPPVLPSPRPNRQPRPATRATLW